VTNPSGLEYGFMNTRQKDLYWQSESLKQKASFIEIQVHDKLKSTIDLMGSFNIHPDFHGYITIHGEGETDGKRRVLFCTENQSERNRYVTETVHLFCSAVRRLPPNSVKRVIIHPDTLDRKLSRESQISNLAASLTELSRNLSDVEVCVEPRGAERQGKVLRAELDDLRTLQDYLNFSETNIGLCVDIAQLFVAHGNDGVARFLKELTSIRLPVKCSVA
jgi:hypothetical protein